ncbi:MAG: AAA family ATPase [Candidatus Thiodiazotropha sp.]
MFHDFFGIAEDPFSITPDPKYLYLSERHRNGFAHLLFGVTEGGGFVQLTGEVGTGKTLLCRKLLQQLPQAVDVAYIYNPRMSPLELVAAICDELRVLYPLACNSIKEIVDFLNAYLLESHAQGRHTVVIIDEAQNLSIEALEQIRLLTNLETPTQKLLRIILVGQPELKQLLVRPELRQLAQRITARYHLTPLTRDETRAYIRHRLQIAGLDQPVFTPAALRRIHKLSGGIPRLINILCSRSMLSAFARQERQITRFAVSRVSRELSGEEPIKPSIVGWQWMLAGVALSGVLVLLLSWFATGPEDPGERIELDAQASLSADPLPGTVAENPVPPGPHLATEPEVPSLLPPSVSGPQAERSATSGVVVASVPSEQDANPSAITDPETLDRHGLEPLIRDHQDAFATLFGYWQVVYPPATQAGTPCDHAESVGLSCIYGRGGWRTLEYYNRPAILELLMEDGQRYQVTVSGLRDDRVTLDINGRRLDFSREEIDRLWNGSYLLLWRPPKLQHERLQLGHSGGDVVWLISMLDRVEGVKTEYDPRQAVFDEALQQRVIRFQRQHALLADGIVGRQTLIQLNQSVSGSPRPVLVAKRNE